MSRVPLITLCSDFGLADEYVGVMKGVILGRLPEARLVDLSHAVPAQDIRAGALLLRSAAPWFPPGTVHLVVVDPGVGGRRAILAARAGGQYFVGPDNGLLLPALRLLGQATVHCLANHSLHPPNPSASFHGRDVMAPLAARLAAGLNIESVGPRLDLEDCVKLDEIEARLLDNDREILGEVVQIDRFGNLLSNVGEELLKELPGTGPLVVEIAGRCLGLRTRYEEVEPGEALTLIGSRGSVEIAVNQGSAAQTLGQGRGMTIRVSRQETERSEPPG